MFTQNFQYDKEFLYHLDKLNLKNFYVKIVLLTWDEKPIKEIQGKAISGSINVNGAAPLRRTLNVSLVADKQSFNLENINNLISINKKFNIYVGYENLSVNYIEKYGNIVWFPLGLFLISTANSSYSTSGINISLTAKDKMCLLDGSVGGKFPASVTFHESYETNDEGEIYVTNPTIFTIIQESVVHYGREHINNVIINDLDNVTKMLVKYTGDTPIWFSDNYNSFVISNYPVKGFNNKYNKNDDVGYMETDFTFPGELTFNAGNTVVNLLDRIIETLGNYEYFYNLQGQFIFQEKKNYLNNYYTPIVNLGLENYIQNFSNSKYVYSFNNADTISSYSFSPDYSNIKNDFICWGTKELATGESFGIRYHLAIDKKPALIKSLKYMFPIINTDSKKILRYEYSDSNNFPELNKKESFQTDDKGNIVYYPPAPEWREEIYRNALENSLTNSTEDYYDQEMLAEWRSIFDPINKDFEREWMEYFPKEPWIGWNPQVFINPNSLKFWLDFIDNQKILDQFSVDNIGRRTEVIENNNIKSVYNSEIQDVIFLKNDEAAKDKINYYNKIKQPFCLLKEEQMDYFTISSTGASCFDFIRESLYSRLVYNTKITIQCQPKYYLEPNSLVYIENKECNIYGDYFITDFTLPLDINGDMTINAVQALTRY